MLLVYSSASLLPSVLYPPLAFPPTLPSSIPAPCQLSAHCTTKSWSRGRGNRASPLMCVCVVFFFNFFLDLLPCLHPQPCPSIFFSEHYKAESGSRHLGLEKMEKDCIFAIQQEKSENNCTCCLQLHYTEQNRRRTFCNNQFFYRDERGEVTKP